MGSVISFPAVGRTARSSRSIAAQGGVRNRHHPSGDPDRAVRRRAVRTSSRRQAAARVVAAAAAPRDRELRARRDALITLRTKAVDCVGVARHGRSMSTCRCAGCCSFVCPNGDFGRVRPSLLTDDMHAWVGRDAAREHGAPVSLFPLTDDELLLRDLAYPLIEPPYDRQRWYSVLGEYGMTACFRPEWYHCDPTAYAARLMTRVRTLGDDALRPPQRRHPQRRRAHRSVLHGRAARASTSIASAKRAWPTSRS